MSQTPAGWYADPDDAFQLRYYDGDAWTEHRMPKPDESAASPAGSVPYGAGPSEPGSGLQLTETGQRIAEGAAEAFSTVGSWVQRAVAPPSSAPAQPTFASIAAVCRDEPPRLPLSQFADVVVSPGDLDGIGGLLARSATDVTTDGLTLPHEVCRLVPNPWNPADPTAVAVFIGDFMVGRLPAGLGAAYSAGLTRLTQRHQLATGTASLYAEGPGHPTSARVAVSLPESASFDD